MTLRVHYHAFLREKLGCEAEFLDVESGASVGDLIGAFVSKHRECERLAQSLKVAVNEEIVSPSARISDGDRIDLLPPYGGG